MTQAERSAHERLTDLIKSAQVTAANARSAPAVAAALLTEMWDDLIGDEGVHRMLMRSGLNAAIRATLSHHQGDAGLTAGNMLTAQLDLWPAECRALVEQIDREAVFVPSRAEFVELVPDAISKAEQREAGLYLIGHGEDCVRRGRALVLLSDMRDDDADGRAA